MTAEVAILNKYGVALAADSAVTIGGGRKIYNSANKLFALTKHHPVGIMIYGAAQLNGIPWETLIKFYRTRILLDRKFDTINGYREDFLSFLKQTPVIGAESEDQFIRYFITTACRKVVKMIEQGANGIIKSAGKITKSATNTLVRDTIERWADTQMSSCTFEASEIKALTANYGTICDDTITEIFEKLTVTKTSRLKFVKGIICGLSNDHANTSGSGIVIAGFGEDEVFPTITRFMIEGRVNGHLKITEQSLDSVASDNAAIIVPFAQREMVSMFMEGIDPEYRQAVSSAVSELAKKIPTLISAKHGVAISPAVKTAVAKDIDEILEKFEAGLRTAQQHVFVRPVLESVAALPLDELALMADALVNLTSFKRRVTMVVESVGGPIDTAVISKGDGFIWIKRKHYFAPELNPHFFVNSKGVSHA